MSPRLLALALLALACSAGVAHGQAGAALPQWASDIAKLMGGSGVATTGNPVGIVQTHDKLARPADGIVVEQKEKVVQPSEYQYIWTGAVSAGDASLPIVQKHPYAVLALQTIGFLKLARYIDANRRHRPHAPASPPPAAPRKAEYFVQVANGNFITGNKDGACTYLYPAGFNKYEFVEAGAGAPILFDAKLVEPGLTGPAMVRRMLKQAADAGLDLLRMNAFAVDRFYAVLTQPNGPGTEPVPNEGVLQGLDYVLAEAQKVGIKVLLAITDYQTVWGGPAQYLSLAGVDTTCGKAGFPDCELVYSQFYTNPLAKQYYKQYARTLINRVNTINGRIYRDDPTIWGWDLMNEARCQVAPCVNPDTRASVIADWAGEMADFVRSQDSNHLVTLGLDGFYLYEPGLSTNPFTEAATYGSDWATVNQNNKLDFASFNVYPDLWNKAGSITGGVSWINSWISQHSSDARSAALAKPAIIKEFGMGPYTTGQRELFYTAIVNKALDTLVADRSAVGGVKGALYYQGWTEGTEAAFWALSPSGRYGLLPSDPAYPQVRRLSDGAAALESSVACPANPRLQAVFPLAPNCPAGYEGPNCNVDINECARGLDNCDVNAACINTPGSFRCECHLTYTGTGLSGQCAPDSAAASLVLAKFENFFDSNVPPQPLRSNKGGVGARYVTYPVTAPGWQYDPTGYYTSTVELSAQSRRSNMTLLECALACETAGPTECTSFFYNIAAENCVLKKDECFNAPNLVVDTQEFCPYPEYVENNPLPVKTNTRLCGFGTTYFRKGLPLPAGCSGTP